MDDASRAASPDRYAKDEEAAKAMQWWENAKMGVQVTESSLETVKYRKGSAHGKGHGAGQKKEKENKEESETNAPHAFPRSAPLSPSSLEPHAYAVSRLAKFTEGREDGEEGVEPNAGDNAMGTAEGKQAARRTRKTANKTTKRMPG